MSTKFLTYLSYFNFARLSGREGARPQVGRRGGVHHRQAGPRGQADPGQPPGRGAPCHPHPAREPQAGGGGADRTAQQPPAGLRVAARVRGLHGGGHPGQPLRRRHVLLQHGGAQHEDAPEGAGGPPCTRRDLRIALHLSATGLSGLYLAADGAGSLQSGKLYQVVVLADGGHFPGPPALLAPVGQHSQATRREGGHQCANLQGRADTIAVCRGLFPAGRRRWKFRGGCSA